MEYELLIVIGGVGFFVKISFSYGWGGDEEEIIVIDDWYILKIVEMKEFLFKIFVKWYVFKKF